MKKINIGAGSTWEYDAWDILDNGSGDYSEHWEHKGKCWDSGLSDGEYDVVFSSHMLEHVPHFRLEKTVSEFNRIMKIGGVLRILVPDLKRAAVAYVNGDKTFYERSRHYTDHLGIGGSFMSKLISPGSQTLAVSREMDEIFGGYAHLYHFDYEMLEILLSKWGFGNIHEAKYGESSDPDMCNLLQVECGNKMYSMDDAFVKEKRFLQSGESWCHTGFDKAPHVSLIIEAVKVKDELYSFNKEYPYNQRCRFESRVDNIKIMVIRYAVNLIDWSVKIALILRINKVLPKR